MYRLFRFADSVDYILIFIGSVAAIGNGLGLPIFTLLFKDLVNNGFGGSTGTSSADVRDVALQFLYLSFGLMVCGTIASGSLLWSAARQGAAMRQKYLRCILRQDISWFDTTRTGEITTSIERDCANVQGAIGEKMSVTLHFFFLFTLLSYSLPHPPVEEVSVLTTTPLVPQRHFRTKHDHLHWRHRHRLHPGVAGGPRPHGRPSQHRRRRRQDGQEPR